MFGSAHLYNGRLNHKKVWTRGVSDLEAQYSRTAEQKNSRQWGQAGMTTADRYCKSLIAFCLFSPV